MRCCAGAVRLFAEEPFARLCSLAQRRRRFGDGGVSGPHDGGIWRSTELGRRVAGKARVMFANFTAQAAERRVMQADCCRCVYQATENSGSVTRDAARGLPTRRGRSFTGVRCRWPLSTILPWLSRRPSVCELTWTGTISLCRTFRLACARRESGCWPICAGALLLATSNRSRSGGRLCHDGWRHQRRA